jgi:hypothetical protein
LYTAEKSDYQSPHPKDCSSRNKILKKAEKRHFLLELYERFVSAKRQNLQAAAQFPSMKIRFDSHSPTDALESK